MTPRARFDAMRTGGALLFEACDEIVVAHRLEDVVPTLERVDAASAEGSWAYGHIAYEAAPALDPSLVVAPREPHADALPLVWFALSHTPPLRTAALGADDEGHAAAGMDPGAVHDWMLACTAAEHAAAVDRIRDAIAAGETYQCNLTTRLTGRASGDPFDYYRRLVLNQGGDDSAWLDTGRFAIASASPECFFRWSEGRIRCTPMKGTAPRGVDAAADRTRRAELLGSAKERAENLMILDLMRNDLSRIARTGTVRVDDLFRCERYDTVWQLTSSVSGEVAETTTLTEVLRALFPCGSITGAPKARTMELIAELEGLPRGMYCGAIGWLAPAGSPERARFNVAIRTVVIDRATGTAEYGVGGGITWGSRAEAEFAELGHKAAVLRLPENPDIRLIETFARRGGEFVHLDAHLERLAASAAHFGRPFDEGRVRALLEAESAAAPADARVRLTLDRRGRAEAAFSPAPEHPARPRALAIDTVPVDRDSRWLRHKTTNRTVYEDARHRHPEADDVVLVNGDGNVTETTIANLAVRLHGRWVTPPTSDGCLPGVGRRMLIERGLLEERSVSVAELRTAEGVEVVSSLRGRLPARILPAATPAGHASPRGTGAEPPQRDEAVSR